MRYRKILPRPAEGRSARVNAEMDTGFFLYDVNGREGRFYGSFMYRILFACAKRASSHSLPQRSWRKQEKSECVRITLLERERERESIRSRFIFTCKFRRVRTAKKPPPRFLAATALTQSGAVILVY